MEFYQAILVLSCLLTWNSFIFLCASNESPLKLNRQSKVHLLSKDTSSLKQKRWEEFKTNNKKKYRDAVEDSQRFKVFENNLVSIDKYNVLEGTMVYGINQFSDLTDEEFATSYLGAKGFSLNGTNQLKASKFSSTPRNANSIHLNSGLVDWTGILTTPVKDQGLCGSCWAFAAIEQVESDAKRQLGILYNLSAQQLVSCDYYDSGCSGGNLYTAFQYIAANMGVMLESDYPYISGKSNVLGQCLMSPSFFKPVISVLRYDVYRSEFDMSTHLQTTGPLVVTINADAWKNYKSGIITEATCTIGAGINHAAQLVGINSNPTSGVPYWKVRNQWGTSFGMSGYLYLKYGTNTCGMASYPAYFVSTGYPPTRSPSYVSPAPFTCPPYTISKTNDALDRYVSCFMKSCYGETIRIRATCGANFNCSSDTYIRLFEFSSYPSQVDYNDNASNGGTCSACSQLRAGSILVSEIVYDLPSRVDCQIYQLRQGCAGLSNCSGQFTVEGAWPIREPTMAPTINLSPTFRPSLTFSPSRSPDYFIPSPFNCTKYKLINSNSALTVYQPCYLYASPGDIITITACPFGTLATCSQDTFLRLFNSNGVEVAQNDDTANPCKVCGQYGNRISELTYAPPLNAAPQIYTLRQGCYQSTPCTAQFTVLGAQPATLSPTQTPSKSTLLPTRCPADTMPPTSIPSSPSKSPSKYPSSSNPTFPPSQNPTFPPSRNPSRIPTRTPACAPSTSRPSWSPSISLMPTSATPSTSPSIVPTRFPSIRPTNSRTILPSTRSPTLSTKVPVTTTPSKIPTRAPSKTPTRAPSKTPTKKPSKCPTAPSLRPSRAPTKCPLKIPSCAPN